MIKKLLIPVAAAAVMVQGAHADGMTKAQREQLSKALDRLINKSKATLTSRQATAYKAYKNALGSSTKAMELYLDCYEKVNFIEAGKKSSDFRDWKRAQKERLSEPGFRLALRHQLNWLVLTLEASRNEEPNYSALSAKARGAVENIFDDASRLDHHHGILKQDVLSSVFAKAYGFGSYKIKDWPTTPLNIPQVYDKIVFPTLREKKKASTLHSAWKERISYQEAMLEHWAPVPKSKTIGMKKDLKPPAYNKFIETERPKLIWQMELDVYKAGDEYGSASRMIRHLERNISHNSAPEWAKQLSELIGPPPEESETPNDEPSEPPVVAQETPTSPPTPQEPENKNSGGYIELPVN
ncbi:hypothetical protein [Rubritalea tangerina]|uniref:Uncharacterized protein n=1 Tax=Rubritalea tangerina TaxID=430798 RepID=A0ABW4ZDC7_9BACT